MEYRPFIVATVTNWWWSAGVKTMIQEKKSGIFLRFRPDSAYLSYDFKSEV